MNRFPRDWAQHLSVRYFIALAKYFEIFVVIPSAANLGAIHPLRWPMIYQRLTIGGSPRMRQRHPILNCGDAPNEMLALLQRFHPHILKIFAIKELQGNLMTNRHEEKQPNRPDGKICQLDVLNARYSADQMLRAREHHHNYTN